MSDAHICMWKAVKAETFHDQGSSQLAETLEASAAPEHLPVKEGGQEPPQQDFMLHPCTQVAVHELATRDVDPGA